MVLSVNEFLCGTINRLQELVVHFGELAHLQANNEKQYFIGGTS
jgi:hypothetical protein